MRRTCLDMVHQLARDDQRIVFIGSDLGAGVLQEMKDEMPERYFMEGVAEQNIIGMAAGMALCGIVPYVNTIATFITRRCFEQIAIDLCLQDLPVRLIGNGGGLVYAPLGPTHMAIEDIAIMRALPNMTVVVPTDADEMRRLMRASVAHPGPIYIRVAKGGDEVVSRDADGFEIGKSIRLRDGDDVALIGTGVMVARALGAAEILAESGVSAAVLNMHTVKPIDVTGIIDACADKRLVVTVEEHVATGGLGSAVADVLISHGGTMPRLRRLAIPDAFPENYGSQDALLERYGLQPSQIAAAVLDDLALAAAE